MAGLMRKFKEMWTAADDEYDYEEDDEQQEEEVQEGNDARKHRNAEENSRVINIHSNKLQVVLCKPEGFGDDTTNIADELLKMNTIVLNLENANKDSSRRIVDFLSGVAYANGGKIKKAATDTYVITPYNVDITGDSVLDGLENSGVCF